MKAVIEAVWQLMNSPVGITAVAGLVLWALNRLYTKRPAWKRYEGTIISAVKAAEKAIPDDTPSKSAKRLDAALRYVLRVYEEVEGRRPTKAEVAELTEGINITHQRLEEAGTL
jgi:hypothetical protein